MGGPTPANARTIPIVDRTIRERIRAHQALIATRQLVPGALARLNLLADGDSWFDYPLTGDMLDASDIIVQLASIISPAPYILNLAHYGDATTQLLGVARRDGLIAALSDPRNGAFDAILFSGGGNDLIGDQFRLWLLDSIAAGNDPANALNGAALADIMGVVDTAYADLVAARDAAAPGIPIFIHAYDFALPTNNGVCGVGPWLFPSLYSRGWMRTTADNDLARGAAIVKAILLLFKAKLKDLAAHNTNVVFVETQGALTPNEWANELHPTPPGFLKMAHAFVQALAQRFPGRATLIAAGNPADGTATG